MIKDYHLQNEQMHASLDIVLNLLGAMRKLLVLLTKWMAKTHLTWGVYMN